MSLKPRIFLPHDHFFFLNEYFLCKNERKHVNVSLYKSYSLTFCCKQSMIFISTALQSSALAVVVVWDIAITHPSPITQHVALNVPSYSQLFRHIADPGILESQQRVNRDKITKIHQKPQNHQNSPKSPKSKKFTKITNSTNSPKFTKIHQNSLKSPKITKNH